jgi:hypothetical protein
MALTDISLLFKDIIETPQQKQQRLFAEGQAAAGQFTGLPTGLRELAMGTASGIPNMVESVRQFGATAGLPVQTQGEQLQGALGGLNMADPASQAEAVRLLSQVDPLRGAAAAEIFAEEKRKQVDRTRRMAFEDAREARARRNEARTIEEVGRAEDRAAREEQRFLWSEEDRVRNKETFDNQMIEWNQSQEDRARTQRASSALKSSLLTDLQQNDPENVYIDILQDEDTDVPLNTLLQIRRDYESDIKPEITIQTVYDPSSNKNMILSIDKNTGDIIATLGESGRTTATERDIPNMSDERGISIDKVVEAQKKWEEIKIWDLMGGGSAHTEAGKILLRNLIHAYSEKNNKNLAETVQAITKQIETENGRNLLSAGLIVTTNSAPQTQSDIFTRADSVISGGR